MKKITCLMPFYYLQIDTNGISYNCCPTWLKKNNSITTLTKDSNILKDWNSKHAQQIRKSILEDKSYPFCRSDYCPYLQSKNKINLETFKKQSKDKNLKKIIKAIQNEKTLMETGPSVLNIAISGKCNLRCIMCSSHEELTPERPDLEKILYENTIPQLLPTLSEITLTGNGDPLFNKLSRNFLINFDSKKYPNIKFNLITNGQLFNKHLWQQMKHNNFNFINVSIDAASKETYEKIRQGGKWETLVKNLQLISQLRKKGIFSEFILSFVVMKANYQEMTKFAKMALNLGCDQVKFQKLFGLIKPSENINFIKNFQAQKEIGSILQHKIYQDPRVDTSQINDYLTKSNIKVSTISTYASYCFAKILDAVAITRNKIKKIKN